MNVSLEKWIEKIRLPTGILLEKLYTESYAS